jgi:hypothetical protein
MLDKYKRHAGVGRQVFEELGDGFQPAGRSAYRHNRKAITFMRPTSADSCVSPRRRLRPLSSRRAWSTLGSFDARRPAFLSRQWLLGMRFLVCCHAEYSTDNNFRRQLPDVSYNPAMGALPARTHIHGDPQHEDH